MADQNDFATRIGQLIKGRSPVGHTHSRLDNALGSLVLDSAGGVQHFAGGARKFRIDETGTVLEGTIPTARVPGLTEALYDSGPLRLTTLSNGWTGDARLQRVGNDVCFIPNGVSAANATADVVVSLPAGFTPDGRMSVPRGLVHTANPSGQAITYRFAISAGALSITGPRGTTGAALYSGPIWFRTADPVPATPPWPAA